MYHGKTEFCGLHKKDDILKLSVAQSMRFFGIEKDSDGRLTQREAGQVGIRKAWKKGRRRKWRLLPASFWP